MVNTHITYTHTHSHTYTLTHTHTHTLAHSHSVPTAQQVRFFLSEPNIHSMLVGPTARVRDRQYVVVIRGLTEQILAERLCWDANLRDFVGSACPTLPLPTCLSFCPQKCSLGVSLSMTVSLSLSPSQAVLGPDFQLPPTQRSQASCPLHTQPPPI